MHNSEVICNLSSLSYIKTMVVELKDIRKG